jgi:hypothetical protein
LKAGRYGRDASTQHLGPSSMFIKYIVIIVILIHIENIDLISRRLNRWWLRIILKPWLLAKLMSSYIYIYHHQRRPDRDDYSLI